MDRSFSDRPLDAVSGQTAAPAAPRKKLFIKSYGCQMNAYDATRMADVLSPQGYDETTEIGDADLIVLNTCHIRERASEKVFSELGKIRQLKEERADRGLTTKIAVAGCVAQAEGGEIFRRQKAVDIVVGPQSYHRLPDMLRRAGNGATIIDTEFPVEDKFDHLEHPSPTKTRQRGVSAFVTIQEGCDKFCTFCVVPYTRGMETSRPVRKILDEVAGLASAGVREITLLGQNVNAYHGQAEDGGACTLSRLVGSIVRIPGIVRVRYTTSHPNDMSADLIEAHRSQAALMPFLHLPVQSGSDRILTAMNRKHSVADYLSLVAKVRDARPDIALSSDFIVGFPGETEEDFAATLDLIENVNFASTFFFKYSTRPGTPGAQMPDQVDEAVKSSRLARLQDLADRQRRAFNQSMVGRKVDVLFEKPGRHAGQIVGKTPYLQAVSVVGPAALIGQVAMVEITENSSNSLLGRLAESAS